MYNSRKKTFGNFEIILDTVYGVELMRINSIWIIIKKDTNCLIRSLILWDF